jgi:aerobic carbon-monoxide dehydrogenase medium subunit
MDRRVEPGGDDAGTMKPAPFDYHAPRQLKEAAELLASLPNAKILAGGQSLVPMMNFRYVIVDHLVDLGGLDELRGIAVSDGLIRIGAMTRQRDLEMSPEIAKHCPLMAEALRHVGHRQTRNRGTIGGSLAHADPAAELPAVCAAYDATLHVASIRGIRQIALREFGTGFMATALAPDEMIAAIDLPIWRLGHGHGFHEFARRQGDFAIAGAAALLDVGSDNVVRRASLTLLGVAASPLRVDAAEAQLTGAPLDAGAIRAAASAAWLIEPISDIHASSEYRRHLAQVLSLRALNDAARRAGVEA